MLLLLLELVASRSSILGALFVQAGFLALLAELKQILILNIKTIRAKLGSFLGGDKTVSKQAFKHFLFVLECFVSFDDCLDKPLLLVVEFIEWHCIVALKLVD